MIGYPGMRRPGVLLVIMFVLQGHCIEVDGACFLPPEYIGGYVMQKTVTEDVVEYIEINISAVGTPIWGNCHRRHGNNFIFAIRYLENNYYQCLHLKLRSKNVLQVLASSPETISSGFIHEESAKATCPSDEDLKTRPVTEITLYKIKDVSGDQISKEYCPTGEEYTVIYNTTNPNVTECMKQGSIINTCSSGSSLKLMFDKCPSTYGFRFQCLGHWDAPNGEKYLALEDSRERPIYRCALYRKNSLTNVINIALSRDSTCDTDLHSSTSGYETLLMKPNDVYQWPAEVQTSQCRFPDWLQGKWEHVTVENNTFTYKNHSNFKTYTLKCLQQQSEDRFIVFSRTQCDENRYNCVLIQQRGTNVFEFQLGNPPGENFYNHTICLKPYFPYDKWITQGRVHPISELTCPISGVYTGLIPETNNICSKLSSVCTAPELMYYKVFDCDTKQVFEEREYKCLGHWPEGELLYTYTQRHDNVAVGTYECFVGSIVSDKEDYIIIKEAGEHCQRIPDALQSGMKLTQLKDSVLSCSISDTTIKPLTNVNNASVFTSKHPTKHWNTNAPDTSTTNHDSISLGRATSNPSIDWISVLILFVVINYL